MARSPGEWWIDCNYPPNMIAQPGIMTVDAQYNIEFDNLLSCAYQVLRFKKLPETIDETYLKMCIYLGGRCAIFRDTRGDGALRGLDCATANKPTIYYMPENIMIVNPTFKGYSYTLTPGEDVAVIFCREVDRYQYGRETGGLFGLISTTAQLLADNTISINVATENMRLTNILAANDSNTKKSIDIVIQKMYKGEPYVCVQSSLIDQLTSIPMTQTTNTQQLLQLIQTRQYIYAHFFEQLGLKTHDQIKKERLISDEITEGTELAVFNIQDMIASIQKGIDECNRIFGTEIEIELHPLIASTLADPAAAEPDGVPAETPPAPDPMPEDDGSVDDDQTVVQPDQPVDYMAAIYQAAAERVAELIRGKPAEPDPPDEDQSETEPEDDGSVDADPEIEPEEDQSDGEPDDDQTEDADGEPDTPDISIEIGDVDGDVEITVDADPDPEIGGDDDVDTTVS